MKPAAYIDNSGHPKHLSYLQGAVERQLYGPLRPLYLSPPTPTEAGAGELLREWVQADSEWSALHPVLREQSLRKGITPLKTVKDRAREWVRNNPKE